MRRHHIRRALALRAEVIRQLSSADLELRQVLGGGGIETDDDYCTGHAGGCTNGCSPAPQAIAGAGGRRR